MERNRSMATSKSHAIVRNAAKAEKKLSKAIARKSKANSSAEEPKAKKGKKAVSTHSIATAAQIRDDGSIKAAVASYRDNMARPDALLDFMSELIRTFAARKWKAEGAGFDAVIKLEASARKSASNKRNDATETSDMKAQSRFRACLRLAELKGGLECWRRIADMTASWNVASNAGAWARVFFSGTTAGAKGKQKPHNRFPTTAELNAWFNKDNRSRNATRKAETKARENAKKAKARGVFVRTTNSPALTLIERAMDALTKYRHVYAATFKNEAWCKAALTKLDEMRKRARKMPKAKAKADDDKPKVVASGTRKGATHKAKGKLKVAA